MINLDFKKLANGVFKASIGMLNKYFLMNITADTPKFDVLNNLSDLGLPEFTFAPSYKMTEREVVIRIPAKVNQDIYGLGLQPSTFNYKYKVKTMVIDGNPTTDNGECPAPVPMIVFPEGYAIAVDSVERATFYLTDIKPMELPLHPIRRARPEWWNGQTPFTCFEIVIPGKDADVYVFAGENIKDAVSRYVLYSGGGCLPPRHSLGVWQRVHMNSTSEEVIKKIDEYRKRGFALNTIGLEPGWHDTYDYPESHTFARDKFPEPQKFIDEAKKRNVDINLWEMASYAEGFPLYNALKPFGFGDYAAANGAATDLTIEDAAKTIREYKKENHLKLGVSGYKMDMSTPYPDHATLPSGMSGYTYRQIFSPLNMKNELKMFKEINKRTLGLTLGGNLGSSGFPHIYYNDSTDLKNYVRLICNSGFAGLLWSPEMCSAEKPEHWLRRIELGVFSANMQINGWWSGDVPWEHKEVEETAKKYTILRTKLMPYFYQTFVDFHFKGIPPFRPLIMEEVNENTLNLDTEFMAGENMLVAPMFYDETEREVYLPDGGWYTFDTHKYYEGGRCYTIKADAERIPVFIREGAMIPMIAGAPEFIPPEGEEIPIEVLCFGKKGSLKLYDDDGITFNYENGEFGYIELSFDEKGGRVDRDNRKVKIYESFRFKMI
ncbi:MAG: DUF5110 domain-containing protein [Clostridia bacterium]|nr:DUF5110 domain-containing protein [Clostridia bacterium]